MRHYIWLQSAVIGFLALSGCADSAEYGASRLVTKGAIQCLENDHYGVVGGSRVHDGQQEAQEVVMVLATAPSGSVAVCTGSLVDSKYVLTAAHCVEGYTAEKIHVVFSKDISCTSGFDPVKDVEQAKAIHIHEQYDAADIAVNDVAMIEISPNARPEYGVRALYDGTSTLSDDVLTALGYGKTAEALPNSGYLRTVNKSFINDIQIDRKNSRIYMSQESKGVCQGDSGGPLIAQVAGQDQVMAILSAVSGKNKETVCRGVAIYMYIPDFAPWIQSIINPVAGRTAQ